MINIDSFTKMGFSHNLFEDSVLTGELPFPYIIVCDGCSGSKDTHLGSHILAKAAEIELKNNSSINNKFSEATIYRAKSMAESIGLDVRSLDATLLISYIKDNKVYVWMTGDGCLYYKEKNIENTLSISYFNNTPYYLSYSLNDRFLEAYENKIKESNITEPKTITHFKNNEKSKESKPYTKALTFIFDLEDLAYLILSTDGIESFNNKNEQLKNEEERHFNHIDSEMHSIKNLQGEFIKRRLNRIIKDQNKDDIVNKDDLGIAGFSFNHNKLGVNNE